MKSCGPCMYAHIDVGRRLFRALIQSLFKQSPGNKSTADVRWVLLWAADLALMCLLLLTCLPFRRWTRTSEFPVPSSLSQVPCLQFAAPSSLPKFPVPVPCPQFPVQCCPQFPVPRSLSLVCCPQFPAPHFCIPSSLSQVPCPLFAAPTT